MVWQMVLKCMNTALARQAELIKLPKELEIGKLDLFGFFPVDR